jgi:hypothetical protein
VAALLVFPLIDRWSAEEKNELIGAAQALALIQRGHLVQPGHAVFARAEPPTADPIRAEEQGLIDEMCPTGEPVRLGEWGYGPRLARIDPLVWERARAEGFLRWSPRRTVAMRMLLLPAWPVVAFILAVVLLRPNLATPGPIILLVLVGLLVAGVVRWQLRLDPGRIGRTRAGNQLVQDLLALQRDLQAYADRGYQPRLDPTVRDAVLPYGMILGIWVV